MVNRSLRIAWALLLVALVIAVPARAQEPDATVRPDILNMRYGPGSEYAAVATLTRGAGLTLLAQDDQPGAGIWLFGRTSDGAEGWVLSDYVDIRAGFNIATLPTRPAPGDTGTPVEPPPAEEAEAPPVEAPPQRPRGRFPATVFAGINFTGPVRASRHHHPGRRFACPGDGPQCRVGLGIRAD
jgi:uncharacterized protein YraI